MIKAVVMKGHSLQVESVKCPVPQAPSEVLADVYAVGICRTDHHLLKTGKISKLIPGHEVVCRVNIKGEETFAVLNNEIPCLQCLYCKEERMSHCENLRELGINEPGGYSQKFVAPIDALIPINFKLPIVGVFTEPLSCVFHFLTRFNAALALFKHPIVKVLIVGAGVSGRLIALVLREQFKDIPIYVTDSNGLATAWATPLGIQVIQSLESDSHHIVIECSGSTHGLESASHAVMRGGCLFIYGVPSEGKSIPLTSHELFMREVTIIPSFAGSSTKTFNSAINFIANNESEFVSMIGRQVGLDDVPQELVMWNPEPGTRTVVAMGDY